MTRCISFQAVLILLSAAACNRLPPAPLESAVELEVMEQAAEIEGRDGGYSALLWGRSVWVYGDTVLTVPDVDGETWHHNSFSVTSDLDASDGLTGFEEPLDAAGAPAYFIAPTAEEEAFNVAHRGENCLEEPCGARWAVWPMQPVFDAARDRALIFYELVYAEPGDFNFQGEGIGVAVWDRFDEPPQRPEATPGHEHPTLLFFTRELGERDFGLGTQILSEDGVDMLYTFGQRQDGLEHPCVLGRVAVTRVLDRDAWTFWDGETWSADLGDARRVFNGSPIMSVEWNDYLGKWLAVYSQPVSNQVAMRTAPALTGPWSGAKLLFVADRKTSEGWVYDAVQHAELADEGGKIIYVSHSRPTGEGWFDAEIALWQVVFE